MQPQRLCLVPLREVLAICRLAPDAPIPTWASEGEFVAITRTAEELSIVCRDAGVPAEVQCVRGWCGWRVAGTFDLTSAVGVLASLTRPLAEAGISIFAISTYDTDYLLVKQENYERAREVLGGQGHVVP